MSTHRTPAPAAEDQEHQGSDSPPAPTNDEPGTNAVEHEPDPKAKPTPDGDPKYIPRSPYTTGNY